MSFIQFINYLQNEIVVFAVKIFLPILGGYAIGRIGEEIIRIKKRSDVEKWNRNINPENNFIEEFASIQNIGEILQIRDIGFSNIEIRSCDELYKNILKRQVHSIRIIREKNKCGVGYFALIGVRKKTHDDFIMGRIGEDDFIYKKRIPLILSRKGFTNKYLYLFSISNNRLGENQFGLELLRRYLEFIKEIIVHAKIKGIFMWVVNRGINAIIKRKFHDLFGVNLVNGKQTYYLPIENIDKVVFRINEMLSSIDKRIISII